MKAIRVRFTVRRMMVAVAAVAMMLGVGVWAGPRRARFDRTARDYARQEKYAWACAYALDEVHPSLARLKRRAEFYGRMREKYERAAHHSWLPVAPDPPEPVP